MKLLLDTHIWLWGILEPQNLSGEVASALESPGQRVVVVSDQHLGASGPLRKTADCAQ